MKEHDIKHEVGNYWVGDNGGKAYTVYRVQVGLHYSIPDSSYAHNPDGLSIAVARCNYLAKRGDTK